MLPENHHPVTICTLHHTKKAVFRLFWHQSHHVILSLYRPMRWQHGSLHGCALEHPFDFAADAADPKGLAPLCRAPAGQTKRLLDDARWRSCALLQQSLHCLIKVTQKILWRREKGEVGAAHEEENDDCTWEEKSKETKSKASTSIYNHFTMSGLSVINTAGQKANTAHSSDFMKRCLIWRG